MGTCINHPERDTSYICMKHKIYLCDDCLKCRDPELYCKFRESCPIWFMTKKKEGLDAEPALDIESTAPVEHTVISIPDRREIRVPEGTTY